MKVARMNGRNSIGIEMKKELIPIIQKKIGFGNQESIDLKGDTFELIVRGSVQENTEESIKEIV